MAPTKPSRPAVTSAISGAPGRWLSKRSRKSAGPPSAATIRSKRSAARPEAKASAMRSAPSAGVAASPPSASASPPRPTVTSQSRPSMTSPRRKRTAVATSSALPAARRQRLVHVGDERDRPAPGPVRDVDERAGQRPGLVERRHEGAAADLDVEDQGIEPGGELLRQDRGGDEVDRLDRPGHVADRVEPPVGRGDVVGLADDRAADLGHHAGGRSLRPAGSRSPGSRRTCRACRRCARARARRSSAHRRRRRRAPGRASG